MIDLKNYIISHSRAYFRIESQEGRPFILLWELGSLFWLIVNNADEILREIGTMWKSRPTYCNKLSRASRREKKILKIHVMHIHVWCVDSGWISTIDPTFSNISRIQVWCYKIDPKKKNLRGGGKDR